MLIGFTERIQTVSEGETQPEEFISITVNVITNRISELNYTVYIQYQDFVSTAIVEPLSSNDVEYDALFGERLDCARSARQLSCQRFFFDGLLCCAARPVGVYRQFIMLMAWHCSSLRVGEAGFSLEPF